ncbi:MAG: dehydrogenase [Actinobacteria bacterium]|nr:MAG: dehydrogenase [Actinomycetota bacterium]
MDSAPESEFRERVRLFLVEHCMRRVESRDTPMLDDRTTAMTFQRRLFDAGLAGLTVPSEYGGQGLTRRHQEIFNEEAVDFYLPIGLYTITIGMCIPVLLEHGTDEQRRRHIANMLAGHEIWCQMFSEPNAGSDVASLQMRALRDGDEWIINGQKVWTSSAHYASYGMCVTRTDVNLPKHKGLTMMIVPMDAPGVTVRPLIQATGDHGFNEVFCDDVRVPLDNVVGEINDGWRVALSMLMNERVALGASGNSLVSGRADVLIEAAKALGATTHLVVRQALIDVYIREQVLRFVALRVRAAVESGHAPGAEGSIAKLAGSELVAWLEGDDDARKAVRTFVHAPSFAIAGGTTEVQRNIIGERVLGLPKDPEVDRGVPFKDVLVNR